MERGYFGGDIVISGGRKRSGLSAQQSKRGATTQRRHLPHPEPISCVIVNRRVLRLEEWRLHNEGRNAAFHGHCPDRSIQGTAAPALIASTRDMQSFVGKRLPGESRLGRREKFVAQAPSSAARGGDTSPRSEFGGVTMRQRDASIWFSPRWGCCHSFSSMVRSDPGVQCLPPEKSLANLHAATRIARVVPGVLRLLPTNLGSPAEMTAPTAAMSPWRIAESASGCVPPSGASIRTISAALPGPR